MNYYYYNCTQFNEWNCYNAGTSEAALHDNNLRESKPNASKTKAYINPRIINYEYIKHSLGQGQLLQSSKIHVNPNFKPLGSNVGQHVSNQYSTLKYDTSLPEGTEDQKTHNSPPTVSSHCDHKCIVKLASQYKVVNKRYISENPAFNKNKYSWSRETRQSNSEKTCPAECTKTVSPYYKSNKLEERKQTNLVLGNRFKFVAAKTASHVVDAKTDTGTKKTSPVYLSKTKIITVNEKKLVNRTVAKCSLNSKSPRKHIIHRVYHSPYKCTYSKTKVAMRAASLVKNKYRYNQKMNLIRKSKYKIDKRKKLTESPRKLTLIKDNDIRNLFPVPSYKKLKYCYSNTHANLTKKCPNMKSTLSWRGNKAFNRNIKANSYTINKRIVKIGGILYKSTSNKLKIAKVSTNEKTAHSRCHSKIVKKKAKNSHVLYVRGEKFLLDKNGKTLIRQEKDSKSNKGSIQFKRIDIGGVTYVLKSQNVLIQSNVHKARHILNEARHKSIATLCHLKKKSALPCMIYHKFGKCIRHSKGLCMYRHDPKNVAVCKRFLKGECKNDKCLLSHEAIKEKMATCSFFLNGCCIRDNCPFLHVKLNKNVDICEDFLHGFCNLGQNCSKRHHFQCPEYDKYGKCKSGVKCLYPHKPKTNNNAEEGKKSSDTEEIKYEVKEFYSTKKLKSKKNNRAILEIKDNEEKGNHKPKKKEKKSKRKSTSVSVTSDQPSDIIECVPKRIKLQDLPSFIPLNVNE